MFLSETTRAAMQDASPKRSITLEALAAFPAHLEAHCAAIPDEFRHWVPPAWDGIPCEKLTAFDQICHVRDIEVLGYLPRLRRVLTESNPVLEPLDTYTLRRDRSQTSQTAEAVLAEFREARSHTIALLESLSADQLQRTASLAGHGVLSLQSLVHHFCSHDQQHLAGLQWLLGAIEAKRALAPSQTLLPAEALRESPTQVLSKLPAITISVGSEEAPPHRWPLLHRLRAFLRKHLGEHSEWQVIGLTAKDAEGRSIGSIQGSVAMNFLRLDFLWVDDASRRAGVGSTLLAEAEARARVLGVKTVGLETFEWQAPGFYRKQGYVEAARLDPELDKGMGAFMRRALVNVVEKSHWALTNMLRPGDGEDGDLSPTRKALRDRADRFHAALMKRARYRYVRGGCLVVMRKDL